MYGNPPSPSSPPSPSFSSSSQKNKFDPQGGDAKRQFQKTKLRMRGLLFFSFKFKGFWSHISNHFDEALPDCPNLLVIVLIVLLVACDASCCEVRYSAYSQTHTASRSRLKVSTVRDVSTTHFLRDEVKISRRSLSSTRGRSHLFPRHLTTHGGASSRN